MQLVEHVLLWTRGLSLVDAAWLSLLVNVLVFFLTLLVGELILRVFRRQKVADEPSPLSRKAGRLKPQWDSRLWRDW